MYKKQHVVFRFVMVMLWLLPVFSMGQDIPGAVADKINTAVAYQYKNYPREKIFVHTNAQVYTSGQTVWYKVYAQAYGKPSVISHIVYVQIIDSAGNIVAQNKLPLSDGLAQGNIDLSPKLATGWYELRSFTAWMMNFGSDGFFKSRIFISKGAGSPECTVPPRALAKYHIEFYPEGGAALNDNLCVFAFKATGPDGLPAAVRGQVLDDDKQKMADIATVHDGMGKLRIQGYANKVYKAIVQFPDNTSQVITLPKFTSTGITMQVSQQWDAITIKIAYAGDINEYGKVFITAYQDNGHVATYPVELGKGLNAFQFKKSTFTTGILRLTVFDHNYIPLAERVVFMDNHDQIHFNLNTDTLSFTAKGKNTFSINTKRSDTSIRVGSYSVSVRDLTTSDKDEQYGDDIYTALLISPELHGSLYHPGYYFQSDEDSLKEQLDLVMLTNGWRHFNWDTVMNKRPVKLTYAPERSQYLAGKIITQQNLEGMKIKLIIMNQDSSKYIGFIKPDSDGRFILPDYEHSGISNVYVEIADAKNHIQKSAVKLLNTLTDSLQRMQVDEESRQQLEWADLPVQTIKNTHADTVTNMDYVRFLKTVDVNSERITPTQQVINEHVGPLFHSSREFTFDLIHNPPPYETIASYLMGRIPGLQIIHVDDMHADTFIYRGGHTINGWGSLLPYIYVNETLSNYDNVKNLNIDEVALIRYMPPPVVFAPYNGGNLGALMIYTKKSADEMSTFASREKFDHYTFNGYTITREFASPNYSLPQNRTVNDNRTTLYWNPNLKTNADGTACFSFYNSDITKGYVVIIQGMDSQGHLGYTYRVINK